MTGSHILFPHDCKLAELYQVLEPTIVISASVTLLVAAQGPFYISRQQEESVMGTTNWKSLAITSGR